MVTDSKTDRTINDVVRDLINEVDGGTLTLPVSEQASQAHDVHDEEVSYKSYSFIRASYTSYLRRSILTN